MLREIDAFSGDSHLLHRVCLRLGEVRRFGLLGRNGAGKSTSLSVTVEPSEGLAPQIVAEVMATVRRLKEQGLSIVLVEPNAKLVFDVAADIVILNSGRGVVEGRRSSRRTPSTCAST